MDLTALLDAHGDNWIGLVMAAAAAAIICSIALSVGLYALRRVVRFSTLLSTVMEYTATPARWVVALLGVQFVWAAGSEQLPMMTAVVRVTTLLTIASLTWITVGAVRGIAAAIIKLHPAAVSDNLEARRVQTQTRVLARTVLILVVIVGVGAALMTFPQVRQLGATLLASAGVAGLAVGIAARPVIGKPDRGSSDRPDTTDTARRRGDHRRRVGPHRGDHCNIRRRQDMGRAAAHRAAPMGDRASVPELDASRCAGARHGAAMGRLRVSSWGLLARSCNAYAAPRPSGMVAWRCFKSPKLAKPRFNCVSW